MVWGLSLRGLLSWDLRHGATTVFTNLKTNLPSPLIIYG
jgi:hypothetical protein